MKDYYKILEVEVSATHQEIRKAYRKLAQQYHPDKNQQDRYAAEKFSEIKEAYEVLTNPAKKEYYLEQRWFQQSQGNKRSEALTTPVSILKQMLDFDRHISRLDVHRMDKESIFQYLDKEILTTDAISKLNNFEDTEINKEIISLALKNLGILSSQNAANVEKKLLLINADEEVKQQVTKTVRTFYKKQQKEKYRIWILLLIVTGICLLIFLVSR